MARISALIVSLVVACGGPQHAAPAHRYPVPAQVGTLVADDRAFAAFARAVRADLDPRADDKEALFVLAVLDALDDHWAEAVAKIDRIAALETDPADKAMTGLTIRVWADALGGGGTPEAFGAALERALAKLPLALVHDQLAMLRAMGQVFTPEVCRTLVDQGVHPSGGTVSLVDAHTIAFQRYAAKRLAPVGAVIDRVLGAHGIEPRGD